MRPATRMLLLLLLLLMLLLMLRIAVAIREVEDRQRLQKQRLLGFWFTPSNAAFNPSNKILGIMALLCTRLIGLHKTKKRSFVYIRDRSSGCRELLYHGCILFNSRSRRLRL